MEESMKRPAGLSSAREDLISRLPEALVYQILLHLPTKESVTTSVLSNRWKSVWLLIPGLDLNTNEFPSNKVFVDFVEKFLHFSKIENSCLHKLKLSIDKDHGNGIKSSVTRWMDFVVTHKVKHLDVECLLVKRKCLEVIPLSLYSSQTLINLRLHRVKLGIFKSFSSLPRLKYLKFIDELSRTKIVTNLDSLAKVEIVGYYSLARACGRVSLSPKQMARNFFTGISRVRHMIISSRAMRLMCCYLGDEPSTRLYNLSCLEAQFFYTNGKSLPTFLETCPNLKSIVLNLTRYTLPRSDSVSLWYVPQCLLSSLQFVEIKSGFNIRPLDIRIARYFVENSVFLKKLVLHLSLSMDKKSSDDLENLLALPRRSSMCEILHVYDR